MPEKNKNAPASAGARASIGSPRYSSSSLWLVVTRTLYLGVVRSPEPARSNFRSRLVLASLPMGLAKSLLKIVVVLGILAAIGMAAGVIKVNA
jgi:hypothetical protein